MSTAIQFAAAMTDRLFHINETFSLRVGLDVGCVVAGVVGGRKPQFDIWGDCVNMACNLERSGLMNCLNVSRPIKQWYTPLIFSRTNERPFCKNTKKQ